MTKVTLAWRFQPGTDHGSSSRSYSATKVCDVENTKKGTRYADVFPDDEIFSKYNFIVDRVDNTAAGQVVVSEVVFVGGLADEFTDVPVRAAFEAAGWEVTPDKFNEPEED